MRKFLMLLLPVLAVGFIFALSIRIRFQEPEPLASQRSETKQSSAPAVSAKVEHRADAHPIRSPAQASQAPQAPLITELLNTSGVRTEFTAVGRALPIPRKALQTSTAAATAAAFDEEGHIRSQLFEDTYRRNLHEQFGIDELHQLRALHAQTLVRTYLQNEQKFLSEMRLSQAEAAFRNFEQNPPSSDRLGLFAEFDATAHISENHARTLKALNAAFIALTHTGSPTELRAGLITHSTYVQLASSFANNTDNDIRSLTQTFKAPTKQKELAVRQESIEETLSSVSH